MVTRQSTPKNIGTNFRCSWIASTISCAMGATTAPEAFIVGSDSKVLYRGRIDDRFVALGKPRHEVRERDLRRALEAVIEGRKVEVAETKPVGCLIPDLE